MTPDRLTSEHLAAIETACENALAEQRSPGIGVHTILSLVAVLRERDNTIARAEDAVASAALKVLADFDTVMNVKGEVAYIVAEYKRALRAALDPQETP